MFRQRSGYKMMFLALIAVLLMSLPLVAAAEMTNGITSPKDGATVSGTVDVKGYASDPSFVRWQLDVLPSGDANAAIFLATGDKPGEFSYTVDTTAFPNGEHALRLRVVRADSNYGEYVNKFTIANGEAKPAAATPAVTTTVAGHDCRDHDCCRQPAEACRRGDDERHHQPEGWGDGERHGGREGLRQRSELCEVAVGCVAERGCECRHLPGDG